MCEKHLLLYKVLWLFVTQQKLTDTVPDLLYGEIKINKEKHLQKNGMGQLKCNSSKSGIYRITSINLYLKVIRIILLFFYRNSSKTK